jgi:hypothetical protein
MRKFNIIMVSENRGTGTGITEKHDTVVKYSGGKVV